MKMLLTDKGHFTRALGIIKSFSPESHKYEARLSLGGADHEARHFQCYLTRNNLSPVRQRERSGEMKRAGNQKGADLRRIFTMITAKTRGAFHSTTNSARVFRTLVILLCALCLHIVLVTQAFRLRRTC